MDKQTIKNPGRRSFLRAVPAAAAAGLALTDATLFSLGAEAQAPIERNPRPAYEVIRAQAIHEDIEALEAKPGNKMLSRERNFTVVLTTEKKAAAKEFEWHEQRDHIFYVYEGSTTFELGGTPQGPHSIGPGEWLAPASEGAAKVTLQKGDYLVIPRGTPHKRTTPESATFTLTAPMTPRGGIRPV
jgi:mannose-6-phosphate isomerase-like protein (cupin superfamily)